MVRKKLNLERVRILKKGRQDEGPIIYWMSRDQRVKDNWALLFSQELAIKKNKALVVIFCLLSDFIKCRDVKFIRNSAKRAALI